MINKESYEGIVEQIDLLLNVSSSIETHKRYEFIKTLLLNTYNAGRWDFYVQNVTERMDDINIKIKELNE
jgi:hypothetical protein